MWKKIKLAILLIVTIVILLFFASVNSTMKKNKAETLDFIEQNEQRLFATQTARAIQGN